MFIHQSKSREHPPDTKILNTYTRTKLPIVQTLLEVRKNVVENELIVYFQLRFYQL